MFWCPFPANSRKANDILKQSRVQRPRGAAQKEHWRQKDLAGESINSNLTAAAATLSVLTAAGQSSALETAVSTNPGGVWRAGAETAGENVPKPPSATIAQSGIMPPFAAVPSFPATVDHISGLIAAYNEEPAAKIAHATAGDTWKVTVIGENSDGNTIKKIRVAATNVRNCSHAYRGLTITLQESTATAAVSLAWYTSDNIPFPQEVKDLVLRVAGVTSSTATTTEACIIVSVTILDAVVLAAVRLLASSAGCCGARLSSSSSPDALLVKSVGDTWHNKSNEVIATTQYAIPVMAEFGADNLGGTLGRGQQSASGGVSCH
jgi:hypothetical protein